MFRRTKRESKKPPDSDRAQYWQRKPGGLDALSGRLPSPQPDDGEGKTEVYPDEIDPEWADPDTAE